MDKQGCITKCRDLSQEDLQKEVDLSFACPQRVTDLSLKESCTKLKDVRKIAAAWTVAAEEAFSYQTGDTDDIFHEKKTRRTKCKEVIKRARGRLCKALERNIKVLEVLTDRQLADCTLKRRTTAVTS
jgi:hypothetical protein